MTDKTEKFQPNYIDIADFIQSNAIDICKQMNLFYTAIQGMNKNINLWRFCAVKDNIRVVATTPEKTLNLKLKKLPPL